MEDTSGVKEEGAEEEALDEDQASCLDLEEVKAPPEEGEAIVQDGE